MNAVRIGVVGAGGFAFFAVSEFVKVPGIILTGVYDEVPENSERFRHIAEHIRIFSSLEALCADTDVDMVYVATPPYLHYAQSKVALLAGKHVICEKPATIRLSEALELRTLANERGLLFVVNLMQRYNHLCNVVREMITQKVLGRFLHGFFENYASDEALTPKHWFWDEQKSGGIFIEHGVHFFDLFSGWLGEGKVLSAQKMQRPGYPGIWDKVQATVLYSGGVVNFYHGFDQPRVMDRQEMRLQFELGEITLYEWVPTRLRMTALCTDRSLDFFKRVFPKSEIRFLESHEADRTVRGNFRDITYRRKICLDTGDAVKKQELYQQLVRSMLQDQVTWIWDKKHVRRITDENAVTSLAVAEAAEQLALRIGE